jgi:hypothetical protein
MPITALADRAVTVYRRTAYIVEPASAAATLTLARQPARACLVEVAVSGGTSGTGTVTVSGTVNGSPDSQALTFSGRGRQVTTKRFTAISSITTTGLHDEPSKPTISASAVGADGGRLESDSLVASGWPMRKDAGTAGWPVPVSGSAEVEVTRFYMDFTEAWAPREGDVFVDDRTSEQWQVQGRPTQHGGGLREPHHWEIRVKRREGSLGV